MLAVYTDYCYSYTLLHDVPLDRGLTGVCSGVANITGHNPTCSICARISGFFSH